ncbi:membrane dipeptidase [Clostridiaceae bacterium M8S5]|nr:membrane dipeptidase [Clostridiaceae bacterium M8S5]
MSNFDRAKELHRKFNVADCHLDLAKEIYQRYNNGEKEVIKNYYLDQWKNAGVKIVVSSIFVDDSYLPELGLRVALDQLSMLRDDIRVTKEDVTLVTKLEEFNEVMKSDKIGIMLSLEGLAPIGNDIHLLKTFYNLGVRGAGLTWSRSNYVAQGVTFGLDSDNDGGLTKFGFEVIKTMNELNMFIDFSHLNDKGIDDVLKHSYKPVIASHSNCRQINNISRNLCDEHICKIAQSGGFVGINNIIPIIGKAPKGYINAMCDNIDHIHSLVGTDHIGFGFDICKGIDLTSMRYGNIEDEIVDALKDYTDSILITEELLNRGYSESQIEKIIGLNIIKFMEKILSS